MSLPTTFLGLTAASIDFLRKNGTYYVRSDGNLDVFAEKSSSGRVLIYLLFREGQLRVVSLAELQKAYPNVTTDAAELDKLPLTDICYAPRPIGQLVYRAHQEDVDNRSGLVHAAYDAALGQGVTHATARWFSNLVQEAFSGKGIDQQFTAEGVRFVADTFYTTATTLRRQLGLLQDAGALTFAKEKGGEGFVVRYNRKCLPGMAHELAPQFFQALSY